MRQPCTMVSIHFCSPHGVYYTYGTVLHTQNVNIAYTNTCTKFRSDIFIFFDSLARGCACAFVLVLQTICCVFFFSDLIRSGRVSIKIFGSLIGTANAAQIQGIHIISNNHSGRIYNLSVSHRVND